MSGESKWVVVIDGETLDQTFDDEQAANNFAGRQRRNPDQKIAVFQPNTPRHQKAFDRGFTKMPIRPKADPKK